LGVLPGSGNISFKRHLKRMKKDINTRREFIKTISVTTAGLVIGPQFYATTAIPNAKPEPVCVFSKCLQFLDYDHLGEALAKVGFNAVDLTVREDGHVLPEKTKEDLPKAVKALNKSGISVPMIVTRIGNPDDPQTEQIIGTASELAIKYYRIGPLKYDRSKSIQENLDRYKNVFEKFEKINQKYSIHGCYQNHPGVDRVGAPLWDLYWLLKDCNPVHIGVQYDIGQAVMEQSESWPLAMKLLSPWIKTTVMKDFLWQKKDGIWGKIYTPLGTGLVDFDAYFKEYIRLGLSGPITIHYEFDLGGAESGKKNPTMSLDEIVVYLKNDLKWCKNMLYKYGIQ
jgi:L-ribulose-5-phosphate 3-epimerase